MIQKIFFLSGKRQLKSDENNNHKIRHQRPRIHSWLYDLKTSDYSENISISATEKTLIRINIKP